MTSVGILCRRHARQHVGKCGAQPLSWARTDKQLERRVTTLTSNDRLFSRETLVAGCHWLRIRQARKQWVNEQRFLMPWVGFSFYLTIHMTGFVTKTVILAESLVLRGFQGLLKMRSRSSGDVKVILSWPLMPLPMIFTGAVKAAPRSS